MRHRIGAWVQATMVMVALAGCAAKHAEQGANALPLQRHYAGDDAGLKTAAVTLVNSKAELDALGSQELASKPVDFEHESLVVVALGQRPTGGWWAKIDSVQLQGDQLFVQATINRPAEGVPVLQVVTHPYAAAVISKVAKALPVLEPEQLTGAQPRP